MKLINITFVSDIYFIIAKHNIFCNKKGDFQLPQYTISEQKVVTPEKMPSNARVFNPSFVDKIRNPGTGKAYFEKNA